MNVSLTPELEKFVSKKVGSGRYNSASEVVREALRLTGSPILRPSQDQPMKRLGKGVCPGVPSPEPRKMVSTGKDAIDFVRIVF